MANINAKTEVITPEVARCYLEHNDINRIPNKGQIAFYANMMQNGEWQLNGEAIVFSEDGRLIDGQHRLMACVYANVPFETLVVRGVQEGAFVTIDKGRTRTHADIFRISGIANSSNISAIILKYKLMSNSPSNLSRGGEESNSKSYFSTKQSSESMMKEYGEDPEYWQDIYSFSASCYRRCRLFTVSFIGGVTAYLNKEKGYEIEYVRGFFEQLYFEEITEMNVFRTLRRMLMNDAMKAGKIRMSNSYKIQLLIKAWEAYKNDKDVQCLKWDSVREKERVFE